MKSKSKKSPRVLSVGSCRAKRGAITKGSLLVARRKSGKDLRIPIYIAQGKRDGRTIFISAGNHGDELNGIYILQKFLDQLEVTKLRGTIIFIPVINPLGYSMRKRRVTEDKQDVNRCYPGKKNGSISEQIAYNIFEHVIRKCSLGIDLHDSGGGAVLLPHCRSHIQKVERAAKCVDCSVDLAAVFGTELILERAGDAKMMSVAAFRLLNIPVLTVEIGGGLVVQDAHVEIGLRGLRNILKFYSMLSGKRVVPRKQFVIRYDRRYNYEAKQGGLLSFTVDLGKSVKKGEVLAEIRNPLTRKTVLIKAREDGILIARKVNSTVRKGGLALSVLHFCGPGKSDVVCSRYIFNKKEKNVDVVSSSIAVELKRAGRK